MAETVASEVRPDTAPPTDVFVFGPAQATLADRTLRVQWEHGTAVEVPYVEIRDAKIVDDVGCLWIDASTGDGGGIRLLLPARERTAEFEQELRGRVMQARPRPSPGPPPEVPSLYVGMCQDDRWVFYHARKETLLLASGRLLVKGADQRPGRARTG